ncbi:UDP-Glycosyltransferase/glycogen phosphorylase [Artomyces pyxidatus]|uniref:UDP-Glycosyltransferase/glycogen phosphorylase n=1 Tax=Artomyces pyxidatus TaxID=48021 RepID=A0ACB8STH0_9AGAM|nr:UDP-Glycosyltransferase/glycogen phosphorylase [Artomyces pyxidatus]
MISTSFWRGPSLFTLMREPDSQAVRIRDDEFVEYYGMVCHRVLWPYLHYVVPNVPEIKFFYESKSFGVYVKVNQMFADAIVADYHDVYIIWMNDYHLMLVMFIVCQTLPSAITGFFLNVALPPSHIFHYPSMRESRLSDVLGAVCIGLQRSARHDVEYHAVVDRLYVFFGV